MIDEPKIKVLHCWDDWNAIASAVERQAGIECDDRLLFLAASIFRSIGLAATAGCIEEAARQLAAKTNGSERSSVP